MFVTVLPSTMSTLKSKPAMTDRHAHRRCVWAGDDPLMQTYHDEEWGVPERDSRALWEMLMLEGFQAGLAWIIVLRKREAFRQAFAGFDPSKVARFTKRDIDRLMNNAGIIRANAKIEATIAGARIFCEMHDSRRGFRRTVLVVHGRESGARVRGGRFQRRPRSPRSSRRS